MTAAVPPADNTLREAVAAAIYATEHTRPLAKSPASVRGQFLRQADAALAVFVAHLGQQQAAIDRVKALATAWEQRGERYGKAGMERVSDELQTRAAAVRAALGADL